jgi:hypothetical protein
MPNQQELFVITKTPKQNCLKQMQQYDSAKCADSSN